MILMFLDEKGMLIPHLAKVLEVSEKDFKMVLFGDASSRLIAKINLPLIKLYCVTRFIDPKQDKFK